MFKVQKCYKSFAKKKHHHHHHYHHHYHHCDDHHDRQLPVDDCEWRPSHSKGNRWHIFSFSLLLCSYYLSSSATVELFAFQMEALTKLKLILTECKFSFTEKCQKLPVISNTVVDSNKNDIHT
uniref:Uncharacterized protein n=1 Tax=Glossina austeni TaxID=7395 RepID=A0A1A9VTR3_GLOAU